MNLINELDESQMLQKDLYNMELERINYMLRNYLRDRLRKVGTRPAPAPLVARRRPPALAHANGRRAGGVCGAVGCAGWRLPSFSAVRSEERERGRDMQGVG